MKKAMKGAIMFPLYSQTPYATYEADLFPSLCTNSTVHFERSLLGESYENNPIYLYSLGSGTKTILMTAGVHPRESINSFALLALLNQYRTRMAEPLISSWFSSHQLLLVPMLNPDGYRRSLIQPDYKHNGRDIDLNRNFPCKLWKEKWFGDVPASEVETRLLITLFHRKTPDLYLDIHSRGKGIYYYRNTMNERYNKRQKQLAEKLSAVTGYELYPPEFEINPNDSGGNTVQYFAETFQKPAFTIETVPECTTFPISMTYLPEVLKELENLIFLF